MCEELKELEDYCNKFQKCNDLEEIPKSAWFGPEDE